MDGGKEYEKNGVSVKGESVSRQRKDAIPHKPPFVTDKQAPTWVVAVRGHARLVAGGAGSDAVIVEVEVGTADRSRGAKNP